MEFLKRLLELIEIDPPYVIGELGCFKGQSTQVLAEWLGDKGTLIAVDWFKGSEGAVEPDINGSISVDFWDKMGAYRNFKFYQMESGEAAKQIGDETFDWFWIDGDHRYHCIKRDLELWYPKVKYGGIFAGHDYEGTEYDERYIEKDTELVEGMETWHHGVVKAVNERFGIPNRIGHCWWIRKE
jgi:predicted O-methyltransferase YrrM